MPTVVVKSGSEAGRRVELSVAVAIGRQDGDLVLEDPEVSRRHAVLRREGESIVVEDLDSTNGTFVNGERIQSPIPIVPGDLVRVGQTTLEIEPDWRADDTIVSTALEPDQTRSAEPPPSEPPPSEARPSEARASESRPSESRPSDDLVAEDQDSTQPLPNRTLKSGSRPVRSNRRWVGVGAVALAVLVGVIAYVAVVDRSSENDFAARVNDACTSVQRSDEGVDLSRTLTRSELQRARTIRLQALGAIRALELSDQDMSSVRTFVSAFAKTNASIGRVEKALGASDRQVARELQDLREDVRDERGLAAKIGMEGCGGLAIR